VIQVDLMHAIREFTGTILNPFDLDELLHRLTEHATTVLRGAGAGIMLTDDGGHLRFVAASEDRVTEAELHQERVEDGACHEAYSTNTVVSSGDLTAEDRWPRYRQRTIDLGLRSVVGVPLNAFGRTIGVINIYRGEATRWTEDDLGAAEILAAMGAGYIVNANQLRAQHTLTEQLHGALSSRDVIGQAKGILMARAQIDRDEAFRLLRERSQQQNRKLREVAEEVVERHGAMD
jgi:GAF domain-containing protein